MFCKHIELKLLSIRRFVMSLAMFFLQGTVKEKEKKYPVTFSHLLSATSCVERNYSNWNSVHKT